jgi:hypothetical protein
MFRGNSEHLTVKPLLAKAFCDGWNISKQLTVWRKVKSPELLSLSPHKWKPQSRFLFRTWECQCRVQVERSACLDHSVEILHVQCMMYVTVLRGRLYSTSRIACLMLENMDRVDNYLKCLVSSDEATFHINGYMNSHSCCVWGSENTLLIFEHERTSVKWMSGCTKLYCIVYIDFCSDFF